MTIDFLKENNLIILECISGSKAYGLDTPNSDTDIKGVFLLPKKRFYGLRYTAQVSNETNDIVYYELGRYMELLSLNNPNILELLNSPESAILYKHPYLDAIDSKMILSKQCMHTFGKFALSQIKKARGLKKKILNPVAKERKTILHFCYVNYKQGSIPFIDFLSRNNWKQEFCGLIKIVHMKDMYGLFYNEELDYSGVCKSAMSNEVCLSSIPKEAEQIGLLYFNKDAYSSYCKEYAAYWNWVAKRNEVRYQSTQKHGKQYDAKNMLHTFRLLEMAIEIGEKQEIRVKRPNRSFLLDIKNGIYEYEDLLEQAEILQEKMVQAFEHSSLPELPNTDYIEELTVRLREQFYS